MNKDAFKRVLEISEQFFGTQDDPEQMPISQDSADKLLSIHPGTIVYKFDENKNPVAWAVIVPTSLKTKDDFLQKTITEKQLLDIATKEKKFDAIYLCAAFVLPEYRRMGYAKALLIEAIKNVFNGKDIPLYGWIYSEEGRILLNSVSMELNKKIEIRAD